MYARRYIRASRQYGVNRRQEVGDRRAFQDEPRGPKFQHPFDDDPLVMHTEHDELEAGNTLVKQGHNVFVRVRLNKETRRQRPRTQAGASRPLETGTTRRPP